MTTRSSAWLIGMLVFVTTGDPLAAQQLRPVVFGTFGVANFRRAEDRSFGTEPNVGGGLGVEWKRLGLDVAIDRTLGLTPRAVGCAVVNLPCAGSAREGVSEATMLAANVSYVFGGRRVRPFVTGSAGVLWTESVNSVTRVTGAAATLSEFHESGAGLAIGVGVGVDLPITSKLSLRPEFRTYSSSALSRANLGVHRGAIDVRYRW